MVGRYRSWILAVAILFGMIAARTIAHSTIDLLPISLSSPVRMLLETVLVAAMFGAATWKVVVVPIRRRCTPAPVQRHLSLVKNH